MQLVKKIYFLQKEELKILSDFPSVYNQYTDILTLLYKYVAIFPLTYHIYTVDSWCENKSLAGQIISLKRNKKNFLIFRTDFIISIPKRNVKKKYLSSKDKLNN